MAFAMIDKNIADKVRSSVREGDEIEFISGPDKKLFKFKILDIKPYSFIVASNLPGRAIQKLELSIAKTVQYQTETEKMRMKAPAAQPSPVEQKPSGFEGQIIPLGGQHIIQEKQSNQIAQSTEYLKNDPGDDPEWVENALNDACIEFAEHIKTITSGIIAAAKYAIQTPKNQSIEIKIATCFDCMFCNIAENKCDKFNMTPPLFVIADAKRNCNDFFAVATPVENDEIPF